MPTPAAHAKVNILLVDDQPARLLSYESILGDLGQNLVRANSGVEALARLMKDDYAVILLDVSMPELDGFETATLIHDHPRYERTPIIFVTGVHVNELDYLKGYKVGAVDYVSIPIVPEILRSKVAVLVELHCQRQKLHELNASLASANARLEKANSTLQAEKTRELEVLNRHLNTVNNELAATNAALRAENAERLRVEKALKQADRHKDEFLAMLAHELRNPLAPMRHAVDVMAKLPLADKSLQWSRDVIGRQTAHLTRLVDDLLDMSRITQGTIKLSKELTTAGAIVERAIEVVQPAIGQYQHELRVECADPSIALLGDVTRLVQVLGNLLNNAAKYTLPGGVIRLTVTRHESSVEFCVVDSGIGLAPESLPKLFHLFSRIPGALTRSEAGLGVGLALVRRIVELHDGQVTVRSDGENKGSEFKVCLPIQVAAGAAAIPAAPAVSAASAGSRTHCVLLVDDNVDALEGLALLLEIEGHEVVKATEGAKALSLGAARHPDIAILDIGMPVMDGYELARRIRTEPWGKRTKLIALSGWGRNEDTHRATEAGFDAHLVKPVAFEALAELMAKLMQSMPAHAESVS